MKKRITKTVVAVLALTMALTFALTGCGEKELTGAVKVAALNGPTGMGMVELMDQENIDVTTYQAPEEVVSKIVSGEVDLAAVPSNLAAVLYNKTKGNIVAVTTIASGVIYIVQNGQVVEDIKDLKGQTIYASGKGGTPEYVLTGLLKDAGLDPAKDVTIKWMANHSDVAQTLMTKANSVALLPEPFVSTVTAKNEKVTVALDLNQLWEDKTGEGLPMGVLIANKKFVNDRQQDLDVFLGKLGDSVKTVNKATDEVADLIVDKGFLANATVAKNAIPRCGISCMNQKDSKSVLESFFKTLYDIEPSAIGGKLPNEDFYY